MDKAKMAGKPLTAKLGEFRPRYEFAELKGKARVISGETRGVDPVPLSRLNAMGRDGWAVVAPRVNSARQLVYVLMQRVAGGNAAAGKKKATKKALPPVAGGGNFAP